jgi:hypothetical protein
MAGKNMTKPLKPNAEFVLAQNLEYTAMQKIQEKYDQYLAITGELTDSAIKDMFPSTRTGASTLEELAQKTLEIVDELAGLVDQYHFVDGKEMKKELYNAVSAIRSGKESSIPDGNFVFGYWSGIIRTFGYTK